MRHISALSHLELKDLIQTKSDALCFTKDIHWLFGKDRATKTLKNSMVFLELTYSELGTAFSSFRYIFKNIGIIFQVKWRVYTPC